LNKIKGKSEEFYNCINPYKKVNSPSECTSIQIPDSEGYKCCSMKIVFKGNYSYNCFALESEFTKSKKILNEYIANISLAFFFGIKGGQIEIECGQDMISTKNYEKFSDEFLSCYKGHFGGVKNETECLNNNIPKKEVSKCSFVETSQIKNGTIINDKRCYIIQDEYFSKNKNLNDYLLDQSKVENLDQIRNINITISSKNYDTFYFIGKSNDKETSSNEVYNTEIVITSKEEIKDDSQTDSLSATEDISNNDSQIDSLLGTDITKNDIQTNSLSVTDIPKNDIQTDSLSVTDIPKNDIQTDSLSVTDIPKNDSQTNSLTKQIIFIKSKKSGLKTGVIITIAILCSLLLIGALSSAIYLRIKGQKTNKNDIKYQESEIVVYK